MFWTVDSLMLLIFRFNCVSPVQLCKSFTLLNIISSFCYNGVCYNGVLIKTIFSKKYKYCEKFMAINSISSFLYILLHIYKIGRLR